MAPKWLALGETWNTYLYPRPVIGSETDPVTQGICARSETSVAGMVWPL